MSIAYEGRNGLLTRRESRGDQPRLYAAAGRLLESYGRTGKEDLFFKVSRALRPWLEEYVRNAARNGPVDPDEVIAVVLTRIFLYSSSFRFQGGRAFQCWVSAIARNAVKKAFRSQMRNARSLDRIPEPADERRFDPSRITVLREEAREWERAWFLLLLLCMRQIARTPRDEHSILFSHHCRGMSFRQIAEKVGERPDRVAGKVRRARGRFLRDLLRTLGPWQ